MGHEIGSQFSNFYSIKMWYILVLSPKSAKSGNDEAVQQIAGSENVAQSSPEALVTDSHADYEKWKRLWPEDNQDSDRILLYVDQFRCRKFDPNRIIL